MIQSTQFVIVSGVFSAHVLYIRRCSDAHKTQKMLIQSLFFILQIVFSLIIVVNEGVFHPQPRVHFAFVLEACLCGEISVKCQKDHPVFVLEPLTHFDHCICSACFTYDLIRLRLLMLQCILKGNM